MSNGHNAGFRLAMLALPLLGAGCASTPCYVVDDRPSPPAKLVDDAPVEETQPILPKVASSQAVGVEVEEVNTEDRSLIGTSHVERVEAESSLAVILVAAQRGIAPTQVPPHVADQDPAPEVIVPGDASVVAENHTELHEGATPIDLPTALALTAGQNPQVAFAQQRIEEAFAQLQAAEVLWVPSLRAGFNYNKHEGRIQDVAGRMIETSRGSIYTGFGAQAVGAGSPAIPGLVMNFHLRDAIYQKRIADRALGARQELGRATVNDLLLETALAYVDLLEAAQVQAIAAETQDHAQKLADLTDSFARSGEGLEADADRARAELSVRQIETRRAAEGVRVASVRLARVLSLDQTSMLLPQEPNLAPLELAPCEALPALISLGLSQRPELSSSQYLVDEAIQRLQRERHAPLMPSMLLGLSYGGNGGGLGGDIENFGDRLDFDAVAWWEIRNLGLGESAARAEAASRVEQARWRQVQVLDQVASEVAEAHAQVTERRAQIEFAKSGITAAEQSYRRNTRRISEGEGLPIEALQAMQALDQAKRQYTRAVADYNRAQFRLQRALGWPVGDIAGSETSPSIDGSWQYTCH